MILPHRRQRPKAIRYEDILDRPPGFTPVAHTHPVTDLSGLDEAAQDAIGAMVDGSLVYSDGPPTLSRAALTGDVTAAEGSNVVTVVKPTVTELATDADETVAVAAMGGVTLHTGVLTADRAVTLGTTGAAAGMWRRVVRTGAGAFNLNVGTGPLKALATNTWADFHYDGSAWRLTAYGAL